MATIDELTPEQQAKALKDFSQFYLDKYQHEGLDTLAQADSKGHIADINAWLVVNRGLAAADLQAGLIASRKENLVALIGELNASFDAEGIAAPPWPQWFETQIDNIPQGR